MRDVLFMFGDPSWESWIAPIVEPFDYIDTVYDKDLGESAAKRLTTLAAAHEAKTIIIVSHHDTLQRDVGLGMEISRLPGKRCVYQSEFVAALAFDKRQMNSFAGKVIGLKPIPEILPSNLLSTFDTWEKPIVAKHIGLTEGKYMSIFSNEDDIKNFLHIHHNELHQYMFQEFVQGIEFSVNVVSINGDIVIFEPISKSQNSSFEWDHPCKRTRLCPDPHVQRSLAQSLGRIAAEYVYLVGAQSLVELEFIVDDDQNIRFLEINPRLSATTRMASIASSTSIFATMADLARGGRGATINPLPCIRYTMEFPVSPAERKALFKREFSYPEYSFSSRATVSGLTWEELEKNVHRLKEFLANA